MSRISKAWKANNKSTTNRINAELMEKETVSDSGISKSAPRSRQIPRQQPTTQSFTGRMPFLPPNQRRRSTEGKQ